MVNLTVPELAAALRVDVSGGGGDFDPADFDPADFDTDADPQAIEVTRLLAYVTVAIGKAAPAAPALVANEAGDPAGRLAVRFDVICSGRPRPATRVRGMVAARVLPRAPSLYRAGVFSGAFGPGFN